LFTLAILSVSPVEAQNLVQNGDFSNGLAYWNPGILDSGSIPGYPKWGTYVYPFKGDPSAFLDVPGGAFAYLDSDPFFMPDVGFVQITFWGNRDPVVLGVQLKVEGGSIYVLDSVEPPRTEFGQTPVTKEYVLGTNVAGRNVAIRFVCRSYPSSLVGAFCNYDDIHVTTRTMNTKTVTESTVPYPLLRGQYVDVDWSRFGDNPDIAVWAQRTGDAQYEHLALVQGVPREHMRRSLIHLDWGIGGWANNGEVGVDVDWFFGGNLIDPPSLGPSAGMSSRDYSLQRLDAEPYHKIAHNMIVVGLEGYRPSWFTEALGTWAQSSVTEPGEYTGIRAQKEDVFWYERAYDYPDPTAGYGKGALFLWWLVDNYGGAGLHRMVSQCFGWEQPWSSEQEIDARELLAWTGRSRSQLFEDFENSIRSGWRADIASLLVRLDLSTTTIYHTGTSWQTSSTPIPEFDHQALLVLVIALLLISSIPLGLLRRVRHGS